MILCVGEILVDMLGTERDGNMAYERKAGGAPFNVACAAAKLGAEVAFAGSVGDDVMGDFLCGTVANRGFKRKIIKRDKHRNTTMAFVGLDSTGERSFCFYRKNTADYRLPQIPEKVLAETDTVYIGSLMLSEKCGRDYAIRLAARARAAGKKVAFDVNFREDIFRDRQSSLDAYKDMLALADIVKFSEDEVEIFTEEYIKSELADKLVCITLGKNGSKWLYRGETDGAPTVSVKVVDTTGAGDAFFGGLLSKLDKIEVYSREFLNGAFAFANVCGALNTTGRGAVDNLPDLETVEAKLKETV